MLYLKLRRKVKKTTEDVIRLLHQYPDHFIQGLFEPYVEQNLGSSDVMFARIEERAIGCLMFDRVQREFNWLAIDRKIKLSKLKIAKLLFKNFYSTIPPGDTVHFFVNTEDASVQGHPLFSGRKFDPAQRLYRSMGLEIKKENRVENKFGYGAHAYRVEWVIT